MSAETPTPLQYRLPRLPELPESRRYVGSRVYVFGVYPALITGTFDEWGAEVQEGPEEAPEHIEWDRLTAEPAPPLRFTIAREDMQVGPEWCPWGVFGNRPDNDSDYLWAHFETHAEAVEYATEELKKEATR